MCHFSEIRSEWLLLGSVIPSLAHGLRMVQEACLTSTGCFLSWKDFLVKITKSIIEVVMTAFDISFNNFKKCNKLLLLLLLYKNKLHENRCLTF